MTKLKKLSYWAKKNPWSARVMITLMHLTLILIASYWGVLLYLNYIIIPKLLMSISIGVFSVLALLYPFRNSRYRLWKHSYLKQKSMDLSLVMLGMLMVVTVSNRECVEIPFGQFELRTQLVSSEMSNYEARTQTQKMDKKTLRAKIKQFKKKFRKVLKEKRREGNKATAGEVALIVLSILLAVGLVMALTVVTCALACSGAGALAVLVLFAGVGLVIYLTVKVIKAILKKPDNA